MATTNVPAVETRGLQKRFKHVLAVNGLELKVKRGEIFGLVGADGAGKTTAIRTLCTLETPSDGEARILGMDTVRQASQVKEKIGYMSERFNLYPTLTVSENLDFFARLRNIPRGISEARKKELLSFCRLEAFRQRHAEHLSGGMQKKLALACSLIHEPEVIFLDEPTTGIDPLSRRDFWKIITGFLYRGITILVSTPYLDEAERFNTVAFMHRGQIIACDTPQKLKTTLTGEMLQITASPVRRALTLLQQAPFSITTHLFGNTIHIIVDDAPKRLPQVKKLLEQNNISVEDIRQATPGLEDAFVSRLATLQDEHPNQGQQNSLPSTFASEKEPGETVVRVESLTRKFGDFTAVDRVSFEIKRGEIFGLLGPNGSGKTTTIRMITGLLKPTSGSAFVFGQDLSKEAASLRSRLGYMSQKFSLFTDLTVEENINLYGRLYGLSAERLAEGKKWVLDMAGLRGKEKLMPSELSGGWKQRLALGCAIIHNPDVVFLDEPTAGVDPLSRRSFWKLIQELADRDMAILITTHYMDEAEHCHRLGMFYGGKLIAVGSPGQLKTEQVTGELIEVVCSDYMWAMELLSAKAQYRRAHLFGTAVHIEVDDVKTGSQEISKLLEDGLVSVSAIHRIPFTLEDVFISMVEKYEEQG